MRIIHTSDWHLGQHFYGKSRAHEHQQFLQWLIQQVITHSVDAIVVAGDVFDTGNPPSYARELYFNFIRQLQVETQAVNRECQLVILAGNHDSSAMIGESKQLLSAFSSHVIPAVTNNIDEQVFILNANNQQAVMCAVPFIRPRDITKSQVGQSAKDKQQDLQQAITNHYHTLFEHAQMLAKNECPIIATGHLTTVGASTSDSVREIYIGTLDAFPASQFPKADYIALGHIHQMQNIAKSDHIRYCGSPIPLSFDESKQNKHVLLVDVKSSEKPDIKPLVVPCFQPLAVMKSSVDDIITDIQTLLLNNKNDEAATSEHVNNNDNQKAVWLDIEIDSSNYRSDIQANITEQLQPYIDDAQIEILLIRRSKQQRQQWLNEQDNTTLDDLSTLDVFEERLNQTDWPQDEAQTNAQKKRLTTLFKQALDDLSSHALENETLESQSSESNAENVANIEKETTPITSDTSIKSDNPKKFEKVAKTVKAKH